MISNAQLVEIQKQMGIQAQELGLEVSNLTDAELTKFARSFERQFIVELPHRVAEIYTAYMPEILLGAMVAKKQMDAPIDGELPYSGRVGGPLIIRACWLGLGDDWEDAGSITTGSPQNWIHSGRIGGTSGNAVKIGENAVHVVIAVGSYHPSPKIESFQFTIDGKARPVIITKNWLVPESLHIKKLDNAFVWKETTTVLAKYFVSATFGATVTDIPFLIGASYIKEPQLRIHDAADIPGTTNNVVMTT